MLGTNEDRGWENEGFGISFDGRLSTTVELALGLGSPEGEKKGDDNGWERGKDVEKGRAKGSSGTRDCVTQPWRRPTRITARGTHDGVQAITKPLAAFTMRY